MSRYYTGAQELEHSSSSSNTGELLLEGHSQACVDSQIKHIRLCGHCGAKFELWCVGILCSVKNIYIILTILYVPLDAHFFSNSQSLRKLHVYACYFNFEVSTTADMFCCMCGVVSIRSPS